MGQVGGQQGRREPGAQAGHWQATGARGAAQSWSPAVHAAGRALDLPGAARTLPGVLVAFLMSSATATAAALKTSSDTPLSTCTERDPRYLT